MADPRISVVRGANSPAGAPTYEFIKLFPKKMHGIENFLDRGGGGGGGNIGVMEVALDSPLMCARFAKILLSARYCGVFPR